ncbi:MAG TPA: hypothetical protein VGL46_21020, partial [Pseudonocardiaceae bacterium]
ADQTRFRVNIDATMNLELMFWAGQNGGNPQYADMAKRHAQRALQDLVRPDGGTWMVAGYDQKTGTLLSHSTKQGYATSNRQDLWMKIFRRLRVGAGVQVFRRAGR